MKLRNTLILLAALILPLAGEADQALADPCGMVPPVYLGDGPPITRVGEQQTYVFFKDGVETFVIRPGFKGKVDEFGMLIPFPEPPEIRKVPDGIFAHIAAAIDPPEVVVDVGPQILFQANAAAVPSNQTFSRKSGALKFNQVRVLRQEAVGMYEVAVLEAGSPAALKRWMDDHKYKFPDGMEAACGDYIKDKWCFVAVKTQVGQKKGVDPKPGQRSVKSKLPSGSTFDGSVQAMGFRFRVKELVVPMRLSSFNPGELRNVIYLLTDGPRKVRAIPEEYVVRQISGEQLYKNVTDLLPLRIINGTAADIPAYRRKSLPKERDPVPHNGAARDLFASDLLATGRDNLSLPHEEKEKELLKIGERLGLRGGEIDKLNTGSLADKRAKTVSDALAGLKGMTLTVIDGDFPREVLGQKNLAFAEYRMPSRRNSAEFYDTKVKKPAGKKAGVLKLGQLTEPVEIPARRRSNVQSIAGMSLTGAALGLVALLGLIVIRRRKTATIALLAALLLAGLADSAFADPCGMVPPVYLGDGPPITRVGSQQTYVFFKDGVETFVIRPGFKGKVDEFGMLIPFPEPPAIRKVPDHIFAHLAAAVDPPEVVVDLTPRPELKFNFAIRGAAAFGANRQQSLQFDDVRVVRQEAVGMYEVAVLEAGSPAALKRWLDDHKYKFPAGMEAACGDYIKEKWCFVAVKTQVGQKKGVDPKPGQRTVKSKLPSGSTFDGSVQAMGFRFRVKELVVPMRLSSFNAGELRNVIYLLTEGPRKVRAIPEEYVVRQVSGEQLYKNVTDLLPLRIIGGTAADIPDYRRKQLPKQRDPVPHNGAARDLFASDLLATGRDDLSLPHEEKEKELLKIGERLGLRGGEIDKLNTGSLADKRAKTVSDALAELKGMTLTVIDGDFPREVLGQKNLAFAEYRMPSRRNSAEFYDTKSKKPAGKKAGVLKLGRLDDVRPNQQPEQRSDESIARSPVLWTTLGFVTLIGLLVIRRRKTATIALFAALLLAGLADSAFADPCGMVPPVYLGDGPPITRIGKQQTYVFYKDGVETFVIRPGFKGKVDEFGMLIPFPVPPAIRKVPDHIFSHIAAAIDPPEVVVDLSIRYDLRRRFKSARGAPAGKDKAESKLAFDTVKVISQEAVGMYEVTVLAAGSAQALKRWLDDHKYKYPTGMDKPCNDYVKLGWCFVAIKTKVGQKQGVQPKPGQRTVNSKLPSGSTFDGSVQAMGFRFKSKELVVPMRLSAFNPGELRNIIYILSDGPNKVRGIPEEYVVRQVSGEQLYKNLTDPLPLRVIGGTVADIPEYRRKQLPKQRNPVPHNGAAADLFASDLLAVAGGTLSLPHEEEEKQLLRIGERLGLRGGEIDKQNATALADHRAATRKSSLSAVKGMTLTVVDGDFPREVLASRNLTFAEYKMPAKRNRAELYDTKINKPGGKKAGVLKLGRLEDVRPSDNREQSTDKSIAGSPALWTIFGFVALIGLLVIRRRKTTIIALLAALPLAGVADPALADPCGMVPPVYLGPGQPITRIGKQQTYVFYKDGVETFVIRPGFKGKVDEFGMLIPFPNPPAIRKVPDHIFSHVAAAVDPPEVVVDLTIRNDRFLRIRNLRLFAPANEAKAPGKLAFDTVKVISQEAVGMYEVTVLAAGSAQALKRWLDDHKYKYPTGMDKPCNDYVELGWCFVAIKTKVGQKQGVDPKPGQRTVNSKLPSGSTFDGAVQAMGFRFKSKELVVPMRLSAFNPGELRNIIYILSDGPNKVRGIPEEYVVRQVSGEQLYKNLTDPLPLRIIGGTLADIPEYRRKQLPKQRNPVPHNGAAKDLFASDLLAISSGELSLPHEEREKQLLRVGERLGLRGGEIDKLNADSLAAERKKTVDRSLADLKNMTLTVIDGDFPREVLAQQNLTFAEYKMPARRNNAMNYDTKSKGPTQKKAGVLKLGRLDDIRIENHPETRTDESIAGSSLLWMTAAFAALISLVVIRRRKIATIALLTALPLAGLAAAASAQDKDDDAKETTPTIRQLRNDLSNSDKAAAAVEQLVALGRKAVPELTGEALEGNDLARRGWSIVALSEIGGQDIDELFLKIHKDKQQKMLVRTWAAAGRVYMCNSVDALIEKAALIAAFPAVGRPVGMRIVDKLADDPNGASPELLIGVTLKVPKLDRALAPAIMALGAEKLTKIMATASDQSIRQKATAYVGALAGQDKTVGAAIAKAYTFDPEATDVLWKGGPLYVPGINWSKQDARTVAGNLIRWHLWCDRNGKAAEQRKISINLASIRLFRVAEYQSVGGNGSTVAWLTAWGKAVGRDELEKLLKEQGADKSKKYADVLENL